MTINHARNSAKDVKIPGILSQGLFWTEALVLPNDKEHQSNIPRRVPEVNVVNRRVVEQVMANIAAEDTENQDRNETQGTTVNNGDRVHVVPENDDVVGDIDAGNIGNEERPDPGEENAGDHGHENPSSSHHENANSSGQGNAGINDGNRPDPEPPPRVRRLDDPIFDEDEIVYVNALNREALCMLWHQRLCHMHDRRVSDMHRYVRGIPQLPLKTEIDDCPVCLQAKLEKINKGHGPSSVAEEPLQGLSIDFGFVVQGSKDAQRV